MTYVIHGLPPAEGQQPDVTTARDLAILCRALAQKPETFKYTGTQSRGFRDEQFVMHNHNKLLGQVAELAWFDLPLNELEDWTARVQALTVEQVRSALQRHVHPERMVTVVLGAQP